jgi:hypothetical protein
MRRSGALRSFSDIVLESEEKANGPKVPGRAQCSSRGSAIGRTTDCNQEDVK